MRFTASQQTAIHLGCENLQLIACAGSGKTEVVARRVVQLLTPGSGDLLPRNIIAFTFTDKAAAELKDRIVSRVRESLGDIPGMAEMFVGTIHAFALELLKSEVPKYLKYEVLNEVQQGLFVDRHSRSSGLTTCIDLQGRPLKRYRDTMLYLKALDILREADLNETELRGNTLPDGLDAYERLLEEKSYLDYASILVGALDALTNNQEVRQRLAERLRCVIVDEYQDVNPIQEGIVWSLHDLGAKICVVGDDDQTIYQWRGSHVDNILTFAQRYPAVECVALEENFRSSEGVVLTARAFIASNVQRLPKEMKPTGAQGYEAGDVIAMPFDSPQAEAQYIASVAKSLRGVAVRDGDAERGISWSDMAVLLRSVKSNGEPITQAFDDAGIPYVVVGMTDLFGTREAQAARLLFYFMASRLGADRATLERAWIDADLGVDHADLHGALDEVERARAALTSPDQKRWGQYSIQRVFLRFLDDAGIREERVPNGRGEIVFYNLGKFSQLISDYEAIHYHSKPPEKYASFADFLQYRAENYYPEGWQDNQYANPDAVQIMTVHQAKGMQWPAVFIPAMIDNRFPAKKPGGRNVWHLLPKAGIVDQPRFEGTLEDERRLFYVALTRSQKFLHVTWAPVRGNQLFQRSSPFFDSILASKWVKRRVQDYSGRRRLLPTPRRSVANVTLTFSDLKYFFECPYQFKLRILYGFNVPIHEALGYGKSLHDALADVHARAIRGDIADVDEVPNLIERHMHTPYAYPDLRRALEQSAERVLRAYIDKHRDDLRNVEFSEKQIEISLGDGINVNGRIDLVRRLDTNETTIVDLKSNDKTQSEQVTDIQLHIYALGYQDLTGRRPDYVETYNLDKTQGKPLSVDDDFLADVKMHVREAAEALREGNLAPKPSEKKCSSCDYRGMCSAGRLPVATS